MNQTSKISAIAVNQQFVVCIVIPCGLHGSDALFQRPFFAVHCYNIPGTNISMELRRRLHNVSHSVPGPYRRFILFGSCSLSPSISISDDCGVKHVIEI